MKRIHQLMRNECRYATDDGPPFFLFCGEPVRDDSCSYCAGHAARCLVPRKVRDDAPLHFMLGGYEKHRKAESLESEI